MPELPEVDALASFLDERLRDLAVTGVQLGSVAVLKTYDPVPDALAGSLVVAVRRHGKFVDIDCDGLHLVFHLAKAGWLTWAETAKTTRLRPGRGAVALRVTFSDGSGFDLTEAGTRKGLAVYVVRDPSEVPGIVALGPDPLSEEFTLPIFAALLEGRRAQVKGLLRDQKVVAGIGNAYSDEILHAAKLSPFAIASSLDEGEVARLYEALRGTLSEAVATASGRPATELKDAKRASMAVHGRTGLPCPVCRDDVREVSFADSSLQYCATCQTGGTPLADRRTSKFVK
ncbi:MAG: DNA-formamidopyrimidine glycosylase family protein [Dermatophilus congolensis]|nr:DNA-formamidopyrimidine glycosylase family protein [Dermatophilus congolensis]